jgi:hypothetical protein
MKAELVGGPHDGKVIELEQFMVEDGNVAMTSDAGPDRFPLITSYWITGNRTSRGHVEMCVRDGPPCGGDPLPKGGIADE